MDQQHFTMTQAHVSQHKTLAPHVAVWTTNQEDQEAEGSRTLYNGKLT